MIILLILSGKAAWPKPSRRSLSINSTSVRPISSSLVVSRLVAWYASVFLILSLLSSPSLLSRWFGSDTLYGIQSSVITFLLSFFLIWFRVSLVTSLSGPILHISMLLYGSSLSLFLSRVNQSRPTHIDTLQAILLVPIMLFTVIFILNMSRLTLFLLRDCEIGPALVVKSGLSPLPLEGGMKGSDTPPSISLSLSLSHTSSSSSPSTSSKGRDGEREKRGRKKEKETKPPSLAEIRAAKRRNLLPRLRGQYLKPYLVGASISALSLIFFVFFSAFTLAWPYIPAPFFRERLWFVFLYLFFLIWQADWVYFLFNGISTTDNKIQSAKTTPLLKDYSGMASDVINEEEEEEKRNGLNSLPPLSSPFTSSSSSHNQREVVGGGGDRERERERKRKRDSQESNEEIGLTDCFEEGTQSLFSSPMVRFTVRIASFLFLFGFIVICSFTITPHPVSFKEAWKHIYERDGVNKEGQATLRIATYNIQQGYGTDALDNFQRIVSVLEHIDADLIGLQESDTTRWEHMNEDVVRYLATHLNMYSVYGPKPNKGTYGIALLSRFPISYSNTVMLPSKEEQTMYIESRIKVSPVYTLDFIITHLGGEKQDRLSQANVLASKYHGAKNTALVCDCNIVPDQPGHQIMSSSFEDTWLKIYPTGVTPSGDKGETEIGGTRIDYLWGSHDLISNSIHVMRDERSNGTSDHYPVITTLIIPTSN